MKKIANPMQSAEHDCNSKLKTTIQMAGVYSLDVIQQVKVHKLQKLMSCPLKLPHWLARYDSNSKARYSI